MPLPPAIQSPATGVEEQGDEAGERVPPDGRVTPPPEVRVTTPLEEDDDNTYEIVEAPEEEVSLLSQSS